MNKEFADLSKKNSKELGAELIAARETQFTLRIKHKTGQLSETNQLGNIKKKIARIKTLINANKTTNHLNELYSERLRAIKWLEKNIPNEFDLYGRGWNKLISSNKIINLEKITP